MFRTYIIWISLLGLTLAVGMGCDANDIRDPDAGTAGTGGDGTAGTGGSGTAGTGGSGTAGTGGSGTAGTGGDGTAGTGGTADPCSPNPCDDSNDCTVNACSANPAGTGGTGGTGGAGGAVVCDFSGAEPDGTSCTDFAPNSGACVSGICTEVTPITDIVSLVCSNTVSTGELSYLPNELTATPLGPVVNGAPVDVSFTGTGFFPAAFLNAAVGFGFTQADILALNASVTVRSGATGGPVVLTLDQPLPATVAIPIEDDNAICMAANFPAAPCVLDDLQLPLNSGTATLTPNGGAGGEILVGWDETLDPTTLPIPVDRESPPGPNGIRLSPGPFLVGLECTMGECQPADPKCLDMGTDSGVPLPNSALLPIPIAP